MLKKLKIFSLIDNTCSLSPFLGEHGLSYYIEADKNKILFDFGASGTTLISNAKTAKIDLKKIDSFVLSHGDNDHAGGLEKVAYLVKNKSLYCSTDAFQIIKKPAEDHDKYYPYQKQGLVLEGMSHPSLIKKKLKKIIYCDQPQKITDDIIVSAEKILNKRPEINLVFNLDHKGLVIVVGCAHHGIQNVVKEAKKYFNNLIPVYALIGGFHLKASSERELNHFLNYIKQERIKLIAPSHCTGFRAVKLIKDRFPHEYFGSIYGNFGTGQEIII